MGNIIKPTCTVAILKLENRYEISAKNEPVGRWLFVRGMY